MRNLSIILILFVACIASGCSGRRVRALEVELIRQRMQNEKMHEELLYTRKELADKQSALDAERIRAVMGAK